MASSPNIGFLFDMINSVEQVAEAFITISQKEIKYRSLDITINDIAKDVFATSILIARIIRNKLHNSEKTVTNEIRTALMAFRSFTTAPNVYTIDALLYHASLASYMTSLIATNKTDNFVKFSEESMDIKNYYFEYPEYSYLNRFSKLPYGTLYYLKSADEVMK